MKLTVLSHAGLEVTGAGATLAVDPWIVGSAYWRSWWNYPPLAPEVVERLRPDFIYLTHIHWDHFQGPSLRKFSRDTAFLVPKGHYGRIKRDLRDMGFRNVRELRHGERAELADGFAVTSYQFYPMLDSALVVECEGVTLLDANDAKFMGRPLAHLLAGHPRLDFVFRSHSSANGRRCFEVVDDPGRALDDEGAYISSFASFVRRSGARYAVPFASNHCFLHREVFGLNHTVKTPLMVEEFFARHHIRTPELKLMLPGDSYDSETGFAVRPEGRRWFEDRGTRLERYRDENRAKLEAFYAKEARASVTVREAERYFHRFFDAVPWPARWLFRGRPITYVLTAGERKTRLEVDLWRKRVTEVAPGASRPERPLLEVHTSAFIFKQCVGLALFSHLAISKRVRFRTTRKTLRLMKAMELLLALFEYEMLPLRRLLVRWRFFETWLLRWREVLLYLAIARDLLLGRPFSQERYIGAPAFDPGDQVESPTPAEPLAGISRPAAVVGAPVLRPGANTAVPGWNRVAGAPPGEGERRSGARVVGAHLLAAARGDGSGTVQK